MSVNSRNTHAESFIDTIKDLFYFSTHKNQLVLDQALLPAYLTSYLQMKVMWLITSISSQAWEIAIMYVFIFICFAILSLNQTPRYNVNIADFDKMHAALYTIDWLDIMEPMNT